MERTQPIEHLNALRKESSGQEKKTYRPYQQKWQAFSRQFILHFLFYFHPPAVSLYPGIFHRTKQFQPDSYQHQLAISYKDNSSSFIFCKLDGAFHYYMPNLLIFLKERRCLVDYAITQKRET